MSAFSAIRFGIFWQLTLGSLLKAVHLDADTARDEPSLSGKSAWSLRLYHGRWQRGVTAGGCRNNADTFHLNPKLALTLRHQDEVVIALNQHA